MSSLVKMLMYSNSITCIDSNNSNIVHTQLFAQCNVLVFKYSTINGCVMMSHDLAHLQSEVWPSQQQRQELLWDAYMAWPIDDLVHNTAGRNRLKLSRNRSQPMALHT